LGAASLGIPIQAVSDLETEQDRGAQSKWYRGDFDAVTNIVSFRMRAGLKKTDKPATILRLLLARMNLKS
jgi:hypothetical protein